MLPRDYVCFVHFVGKDAQSGAQGAICFQNDHELKPATSKWRRGTTIADGPYGGKSLTFDAEKSRGDERLKLYTQNLNVAGKVVGFGTVRTNGSVLIRREGAEWVLIPMPREKPFVLELSAKRFGRPGEMRCVGGSAARTAPRGRGGWWRIELNGARQYRWKALQQRASNRTPCSAPCAGQRPRDRRGHSRCGRRSG